MQEKPTLNVLIPTTSIPSVNKGGLLTPKSPVSRLGAAPKAGRKARRASNLAQLAEQAGASFFEGMCLMYLCPDQAINEPYTALLGRLHERSTNASASLKACPTSTAFTAAAAQPPE